MTTQEFSSTFDTLLNSYDSKAMFGEAASKEDIVLDEYEKSVLIKLIFVKLKKCSMISKLKKDLILNLKNNFLLLVNMKVTIER